MVFITVNTLQDHSDSFPVLQIKITVPLLAIFLGLPCASYLLSLYSTVRGNTSPVSSQNTVLHVPPGVALLHPVLKKYL